MLCNVPLPLLVTSDFRFRAFDIQNKGGLSFRDYLFGLAATEPCTQHGMTVISYVSFTRKLCNLIKLLIS
jgi:hypothetical protein